MEDLRDQEEEQNICKDLDRRYLMVDFYVDIPVASVTGKAAIAIWRGKESCQAMPESAQAIVEVSRIHLRDIPIYADNPLSSDCLYVGARPIPRVPHSRIRVCQESRANESRD